ncbi:MULTISPECIES: hypothetical protein [Sphingomonas]|uniref:Uncharacterized protein n=1 Tax=Sphingomonas leidyi TaxID=68569 RepID=A0A7X5ZV36_9SPHN|nr:MULTISPECIES: hypothetical protein [Sphingomonas]MBN8813192.1 hypothetical protein [Sphingomonas sp.]NIJ64725.1 hypothetical protein [Sphingomonas leidyi]
MPLRLPPKELLDLSDEPRLPRGSGLLIALGIGAVSWTIVVAAALILLRY